MIYGEHRQSAQDERGLSFSVCGSFVLHLGLLVVVGWHMAMVPSPLPTQASMVIEAVLIESIPVTQNRSKFPVSAAGSKLGVVAQASTLPLKFKPLAPKKVMPLTVKTWDVPLASIPSAVLPADAPVALDSRKEMIPMVTQNQPTLPKTPRDGVLVVDKKQSASSTRREVLAPSQTSSVPSEMPQFAPKRPRDPQSVTESSSPHSETQPLLSSDGAKHRTQEADTVDPLLDASHLQQQMQTTMVAEEHQRQLQQQKENQLLAMYQAKILAAISRHWLIPQGAPRNLVAQFDLELAPDGQVLSVELVRSSGHEALDRSASLAIRKASPLPVPTSRQVFNRFRHLRLTARPDQVMIG